MIHWVSTGHGVGRGRLAVVLDTVGQYWIRRRGRVVPGMAGRGTARGGGPNAALSPPKSRSDFATRAQTWQTSRNRGQISQQTPNWEPNFTP
eukprot:710947-Rhodomonas_salina.1